MILLITNSGPAYNKLMINEIESLIVNSQISAYTTFEKVDYSKFNIIISTEDIKFDTETPVIYQNEILDKTYLKKEINFLQYINKMNAPSIRGMESVLLSSMRENTFFKCDNEKTYSENIAIMIADLINQELVDKNFLERMRERERKSSMIFEENVAFPHTINKLGDDLIIALGVSENGFKDNKDLKLIFMACVPEGENNGLILAKTYDELISIIKSEKLIIDISKIENYDSLVNYFIKNTNLYR